MLRHNTLSNYYQLNFHLVAIQNKYSLSELESMIPFERDIYLGLQRRFIEEENRE